MRKKATVLKQSLSPIIEKTSGTGSGTGNHEDGLYVEMAFDKKWCYKFQNPVNGIVMASDENKDEAKRKIMEAIIADPQIKEYYELFINQKEKQP